MKVIFSLLLSLGICIAGVHAQTPWSVKGIAVDTAASAKLVNTTISVLHAKDSILHSFTRARSDGSFQLQNLSSGKFILMVQSLPAWLPTAN